MPARGAARKVMVVLKTKITESGVLYIPKPIRESFGCDMTIVTNAIAVAMFPDGTEYQDVLRSLEIIREDLKHRVSLQERRESENGTN